MSTSCSHLDQIRETETDVDVCRQCQETGDDWVQLRMCLTCGHVACCEDSPHRHATAHFHDSDHPLIGSLEPGEAWRYCYLDATLVQEPMGASNR
ncbi:MAG: hypothetical protein GEV09_27875 [Pseudonocardiaceae bacterium]|nr:hypothetical protein [Pseudonocardiaceae bacterium]